jgi:hypothetical protein
MMFTPFFESAAQAEHVRHATVTSKKANGFLAGIFWVIALNAIDWNEPGSIQNL